MKKAFGKIGQSLGEKTGSREKTQLDEEHVVMDKYTESLKKGLEMILAATDDLIYPDGSQRGMMKISKSRKYKQPETVLANALLVTGRNIGATDTGVLGDILEYMGEVEQQIGDAHSQCETDVTQMFVEPIHGYLHADIKEVMGHKKKLHSRRLDFDAKKVAMSKKQDEKLEESYRVAESKFEESKELTMQGMTALVNGEAQQISQLLALVDAQKNYHQSALGALEGLAGYLQERLAEADSAPPRESKSTRAAYNDDSASYYAPPSSSREQARALALFDFVAESDTELSFREGDTITLTNQIDDNWLEGSTSDGLTGLFPSNYVEIQVPL